MLTLWKRSVIDGYSTQALLDRIFCSDSSRELYQCQIHRSGAAFGVGFALAVAAPDVDSQRLPDSQLLIISTLATVKATAKTKARAAAKRELWNLLLGLFRRWRYLVGQSLYALVDTSDPTWMTVFQRNEASRRLQQEQQFFVGVGSLLGDCFEPLLLVVNL